MSPGTEKLRYVLLRDEFEVKVDAAVAEPARPIERMVASPEAVGPHISAAPGESSDVG